MSDKQQNPSLEAAYSYIERGWSPIPVPAAEKAPRIKGWTKLRMDEQTASQHFAAAGNIGILLGEASKGLVDVDLDCNEAINLASEILPETNAIFGRESKRESHRLYVADPVPDSSQKFVDENGQCIVELRSNGGQTIFPPSTHTSGEKITWDKDGEPARLGRDEIASKVRLLAATVILARHYPERGSRNDFCLTVANLLHRAKYDDEAIRNVLAALAAFAGDEELQSRVRATEYSAERLEDGGTARGLPFLSNLIGEKPTRAIAKILGLGFRSPGKAPKHDQLRQAAEAKLELWRTADDEAFATFTVGDHRENHRVRSKAFRHWLQQESIAAEGRAASRSVIDQVVDSLEAVAMARSVYTTHMRVAGHGGRIYIDLVDATWRAVSISRDGWEIVANPPVRFIRSAGMQPLPEPIDGGAIEELRPFVNVASDSDFRLLIGVIIGAFRPRGPHVVAAFSGEQGSAKTTLMRVLRLLIDPNKAPARAQPQSEDDLYVAAANAYMLSFDNVSYLRRALSDSLCRIATGAGFLKRRLYSDLEEVIVDVCRPVMLNGIPALVERPDLMDRAVIFTLPRIESGKRQADRQFWSDFEGVRPRIFGAICNALSAGLKHQDDVELEEMPRMADLVIFMTAAERGYLGEEGAFHKAYEANLAEAMFDLAAADPLAEAILKVIKDHEFSGTATELLHRIRGVLPEKEGPPRGIPRLPNRLAGALRRLAPALRLMGVTVDLGSERDESNRRVIKIRHDEEGPF